MGPQLTKRSTVLGLPIGPRRTDWAQVGKLAAMGVGVVSTAAGGAVGLKAAGSRLRDRTSEGAQPATRTRGKDAHGEGGREIHGNGDRSGRTKPRSQQKQHTSGSA